MRSKVPHLWGLVSSEVPHTQRSPGSQLTLTVPKSLVSCTLDQPATVCSLNCCHCYQKVAKHHSFWFILKSANLEHGTLLWSSVTELAHVSIHKEWVSRQAYNLYRKVAKAAEGKPDAQLLCEREGKATFHHPKHKSQVALPLWVQKKTKYNQQSDWKCLLQNF